MSLEDWGSPLSPRDSFVDADRRRILYSSILEESCSCQIPTSLAAARAPRDLKLPIPDGSNSISQREGPRHLTSPCVSEMNEIHKSPRFE
jgi:hypothetical protein